MTTTTGPAEPAAPRRRKRHWLRWTLAALVAVIVLVVVTVQLYVANAPAPAPLTLPAATEQPTGPLAGTWEATGGSAAGLRIRQTVLFAEGDVVQRTQAVTGQLAATATAITTATFAVDLTTLTDDGTAHGRKTPQVAISLDTGRYPTATVALSRPADVGAGFGSGATVTTTTPAAMTLRGRTHPVTVTLTARRDGDLLRAAGSFPVAFADWGIAAPEGYGALGSLADHGTAEFLLVLRRH